VAANAAFGFKSTASVSISSESALNNYNKNLSCSNQSDKGVLLVLMKDIELYNIIKDYYMQRKSYFLNDSFAQLFTSILSFLRNSHYNKALETLNLGTLLLLKQTQAELKRLLKFLYLSANSTHAPRLSETVRIFYLKIFYNI
jgi:hypothetical protein